MSNALYNQAREDFLGGGLDWSANDVRVCLVKASYTFDAAHESLADIGGNDNGRSAALSGKSVADGIADASDTSLSAIAAAACNALVIFRHTGVDATARLIAYIDTPSAGLPFTPGAGQQINIAWDNGPNKIFKL